MATLISHLDDHITVDEDIYLRAKTSNVIDEFIVLARKNRDYLYDWMPWAQNTPDESSLIHYNEAPHKKFNNEECNWDIIFHDQMVGAVGLHNRDVGKEILEIGYWLDEDHQGKGIVTRITHFLINMCFEDTSTPAIDIWCDHANEKSAAVALRCGLTLYSHKEREAQARKETGRLDGYRITREEWEEIPRFRSG